jgi:hypothetical protein
MNNFTYYNYEWNISTHIGVEEDTSQPPANGGFPSPASPTPTQ